MSLVLDSDNFTQLMRHSRRAEGITYKCQGRGALLSLPCGGYREDAIRLKMFSECIRDNVESWFDWSRDVDLPVERMDDLILVTGCTLVNSWAAAVFDDHNSDTQVSLVSTTLNSGGASFFWSNIRGTVEYHDSQLNSVCSLLVTFSRPKLMFLLFYKKE